MPTTSVNVTDDDDQVTLVNVFTVDPQHQADLLEALNRATTGIFATVPGFVSANLHASLTAPV